MRCPCDPGNPASWTGRLCRNQHRHHRRHRRTSCPSPFPCFPKRGMPGAITGSGWQMWFPPTSNGPASSDHWIGRHSCKNCRHREFSPGLASGGPLTPMSWWSAARKSALTADLEWNFGYGTFSAENRWPAYRLRVVLPDIGGESPTSLPTRSISALPGKAVILTHVSSYVSESGSAKKRTKRLAIMDQDGANHRFLTGPRYPCPDPALFSDGRGNHLPFLYRQQAKGLPVQCRYRPAGDSRRFSRNDLRSAIFL